MLCEHLSSSNTSSYDTLKRCSQSTLHRSVFDDPGRLDHDLFPFVAKSQPGRREHGFEQFVQRRPLDVDRGFPIQFDLRLLDGRQVDANLQVELAFEHA